jgi:hypothetical protein
MERVAEEKCKAGEGTPPAAHFSRPRALRAKDKSAKPMIFFD